jgi:hypothetical protein
MSKGCNCGNEFDSFVGKLIYAPDLNKLKPSIPEDGLHTGLNISGVFKEKDSTIIGFDLYAYRIEKQQLFSVLKESLAMEVSLPSLQVQLKGTSLGFGILNLSASLPSWTAGGNNTLSVKAEVNIKGDSATSYNTNAAIIIPDSLLDDDCNNFAIVRACHHDNCGPFDLPCNYRCETRVCSRCNGEYLCGSWSEDGYCGPSCF